MTRIVVFGASGMLGHVVCHVLSRHHRVFGAYRGARKSYPKVEAVCGPNFSVVDHVNSRDTRSLHGCLDDIGADIVVNCAGLIKQRPEAEDPMLALKANALLPRNLAQWCDGRGAKLIHVSTDCVFSGCHGYYAETDEPDPVDLYGVSKLLGEVARAPHLTLRTSLIGPQCRGAEGLYAWFVAQRGRKVRGFARAVFSGPTTLAFARLLDRLIADHRDLSGLFHVAASPINKYELLVGIERRLRLGITLERDETVVCDRSLDARRFAAATGIVLPAWDAMLDELCDGGAPAPSAADADGSAHVPVSFRSLVDRSPRTNRVPEPPSPI